MKLNIKGLCLAVFCCVLAISQAALCAVKLPRLVGDGMILQRGDSTKVWGWADANEQIAIDFNGKKYTTGADADGKWSVTLSDLKAGGPYTMEINAGNHITLKDIMVGDVWVCSGQSNMELPMERVKYRYPDVIAKSANPAIRQFYIPRKYDFKKPQDDVESGSWESANPQSVLHFTAAGYFFAKELFEKYNVPIGLINSSLGGSPVQSWMSDDALKAFPGYLKTAEKFKDDAYIRQIEQHDKEISDNWYKDLRQKDRGLAKGQTPWYAPDCNTADWATMNVPGYWADQGLGDIKGVVWFRKEIAVPPMVADKRAKLWLGRIVDGDETFVNGQKVGEISYEWPPRIYDIPSKLLKAGRNVVAVRVICNAGRGGFVPDKTYRLTVAGYTIDLEGAWKYKIGATMAPLPGKTFIEWQPLGLYNAMIAPLLNYRIKGVIWYQGESNTGKPREYEKLFSAMIEDWRRKWNEVDFAFLYVQLASFMAAKEHPSESNWAQLREEQLKTLSVPNTAMAVTIDIGQWNDIHPLDKEDVGKRLALGAEKLAYGDNEVVYSGPLYKSMKTEGNKIILSFTDTDGGLVARGGELKYFAVAGADRKFVWANAKIEGDKVVVWSDKVLNPVVVRYAWADNPEGANLYNEQGLPASPFTTDE
jgi:sialate O-acetylesterase